MLGRVPAFAVYVLLHLNLTTCRSSSGGESPSAPATPEGQTSAERGAPEKSDKVVGPLSGVDTSQLTNAEKAKFDGQVSVLLAPCPDQPVTLAQCISEQRPCSLCVPAANFLANRVRRGDPQELVEAAFRARFAPDQVKTLELADSPWRGSESGSVVIVEWADFECPFCRMAMPIIDDLVKRFHSDVKLVFKNYPLPAHTHAEMAARATLAARKQGKFWKMHAALFAPGQALEKSDILAVATKLGLDLKQLQVDMETEEIKQQIATDKEQAQKLGLRGTPLLYINGRQFDLEQFELTEDLVPWIELEISQHQGSGASTAPGPGANAPTAAAGE